MKFTGFRFRSGRERSVKGTVERSDYYRVRDPLGTYFSILVETEEGKMEDLY